MHSERSRIHLLVLLLLTILTAVLTYPLIFHLGDSLPAAPYLMPNERIGASADTDAIGGVWVLARACRSLTTQSGFFDVNVFYPFKNSFAMYDIYFSRCLVALPAMAVYNNPVFAYNLTFFLSFIIGGFGTYLLVYHFTRNNYAAFISCAMFAFVPYRFVQLEHTLMTAEWMPFAFLYLDKLLHENKYKNLLLLFVFYMLQVLTIWYYALYMTLLLGAYVMYIYLKERVLFNVSLLSKLILFGILSLAIITPVAIPYIFLQRESGITAPFIGSTSLASYLTPPPTSRLYASNELYATMAGFVGSDFAEAALFPGIVALFLTLTYVIYIRPKHKNLTARFFLIFAGLAFVFSLGPAFRVFGNVPDATLPLPYFFSSLPLFKSLRIPARFFILFIFSISVIGGFCVSELMRTKNKYFKNKLLICTILTVLITVDSFSAPIALGYVPAAENIPPVYKWLGEQNDDFAIVELPTTVKLLSYGDERWNKNHPTIRGYGSRFYYDSMYMYFSTYHWKKLVNGYSGYIPFEYSQITKVLENFPSNESIDLLRALDVKYVIIHSDVYDKKDWNKMLYAINNSKNTNVKLVGRKDNDYIYEIKNPTRSFVSMQLWSLDQELIRNNFSSFGSKNVLYFDNFESDEWKRNYENISNIKQTTVEIREPLVSTLFMQSAISPEKASVLGNMIYKINSTYTLDKVMLGYQGVAPSSADFIKVYISFDGVKYFRISTLSNVQDNTKWHILNLSSFIGGKSSAYIKYELYASDSKDKTYLNSIYIIATTSSTYTLKEIPEILENKSKPSKITSIFELTSRTPEEDQQ